MGGGCRTLSPKCFILPHIKTIPISHVKGALCSTGSLHLTRIIRVNLCHFTFWKRRKAKKANDDNYERGICKAEDGGCGCEQTVPSVVQRPGRKGALASRQHKR